MWKGEFAAGFCNYCAYTNEFYVPSNATQISFNSVKV